MPIQYSDNSFRHFDEIRRRQEEARLEGLEDPMVRLAGYVVQRRSQRILRFAGLNRIDLHDPAVQAEVVTIAGAIKRDMQDYDTANEVRYWSDAAEAERVEWL